MTSSIPKIIHQVWFDMGNGPNVPDKYKKANDSKKQWMRESDGWEYRLWNEMDAIDLLAEFYPWFIPYYNSYKNKICQADAVRYFILHRFGGVYMDHDLSIYQPIDPLLDGCEVALIHECLQCKSGKLNVHQTDKPLFESNVFGVNNYFMASIPNHIFFEFVHHKLVQSAISWKNISKSYLGVLSVTGPIFLQKCLRDFRKVNPSDTKGIFIHPQLTMNMSAMKPRRLVQLNQYKRLFKGESQNWFVADHGYQGSWFKMDLAYDVARITALCVIGLLIVIIIIYLLRSKCKQ
jgi:mannosyltransferase OCH1-like enzyme